MSTSKQFPATSFPKNRIKVLLLEGIHPTARDRFAEETFQVELLPGALGEDELCERIADVHLIGVRSKTQVTAKALHAAQRLLAVGCFCIGTNQVDLGVANSRAVPVFNAPFSNTRSVAEMIIAEIVILARHLGDRVREVHRGSWRKSAVGSHEVRGKTVGIIGYGHIGRQVGVLAEAFGLRVLFYDITKQLPMGNNLAVSSMDEILEQSDFVTLHVPATNLTHGMIGAEQIAKMRPGSYLLNASRGSVVDLDALADAVRSGHVAGAAIDVYPSEPKGASDQFESPLLDLPNVVLTPHIGGSTEEAQESIGAEVSSALVRFVNQGATTGSVNFPNVELPKIEGTHRILNAHRNVPGVMRDIARILSDHDANIHAQHLATDDKVGYLITDLDQDVSEGVKNAIAALDTNLRTRILY